MSTGPDLSWQFRVQASLPLFTGFARSATRAQTGIDLDRLQVERSGVALSVEQRVRAALETAASSYAAIALTRDAAEAAARNYELVSDAYARGTTSITALLDAQNAAESSAESAANPGSSPRARPCGLRWRRYSILNSATVLTRLTPSMAARRLGL